MAESKDPFCGFYLPEQLKQIKSAKNKLPFAFGMTVLLTTSTISKAEKVCDRTEQGTMEIKLPENESIETITHKVNKVDTVYLIGRVQSFDTTKKINVPVSYATVIVKGSKSGVLTKDNGVFKLCYFPSNDSIKFNLVISSVGLETKEIEISYNGQKQIELGTIILDKYKAELTEFWVTTKKRSRLNIYWRKITKPFRRQ